MSKRHIIAALLGTTVAVLPSLAVAGAPSQMTIEQAAAKLQELQAQIEAVQAQLQAMQVQAASQQAAQAASAEAQAKQITAVEKKTADSVQVKWKGAPEFSGPGGWSFKVRGRAMFDTASISSPNGISDAGLGFSNELRRARLGVQGTVPGDIGYKLEIDFATGEAEFTDTYLDFKLGRAKIVVGQHNNFQSLEELTSSLHASFIERAAFTDAFNFERRIGASATFGGGALLAQIGVFTDNINDLSNDENNSYSVDGRIVFNPKVGGAQLHFGGSAHYRDIGDSAATTRYRQRPAVHTTDTRFISTPNLPVSSETNFGLEAAAISGPWHVAAEASWLKSDLITPGAASPTFFGGYVEAGYFFTGESRGYKEGAFDRVKVRNPLSSGGIGAISLNVRYDYLDLNDAGIVGGQQNAFQASLNWKPSDYVLFGLNAAHLAYDDAAIARANGNRSYSVDVIALRSQFDF